MVQPLTFHQLRHTNATRSMTLGIHPKLVAEQLGHSSIKTTLNLYSHVDPNLQSRAANSLSDHQFGPADTTTSSSRPSS
ncbi:MAG TPA: tyrosine-type recombinase/integrase [Thermomicrobiales bacterium]|nr:tyrosine-type recombinase/integrase [Thermomicrobiales bacterium]